MDVYIEPFVQAAPLVVVGATPVADAVARLARWPCEYDVVRVVDARERRDIEPEAVGAWRARSSRSMPSRTSLAARPAAATARRSSPRRATTTSRRSRRC